MWSALIEWMKLLGIASVIIGWLFIVLSLRIFNHKFRIQKGSGTHLIVFCHGLGSFPHGLYSIIEQFAASDPEGKKYTLFAPSNTRFLNGFIKPVREQARDVFNELEETQFPQKFDKISIVGISLGGLVGTRLISFLDENPHWKTIERANLITVATPHLGIYPEFPTSLTSGVAFIVLALRYYLSYLTPLSRDLHENIYTDTMKHKLQTFAHRIAYSPRGVDFAVPNCSSSFGVKSFKSSPHFDFASYDSGVYEVRIYPVDDWIAFSNHSTISHGISLIGDFREKN
jgi:hypothetical protein